MNDSLFLRSLECRECGTGYPLEASAMCTECFGPLEVKYQYEAIKEATSPAEIGARPGNMWRYRELLPVAGEPVSGAETGFTPLIRAERLAARWGIRELYIKDDAVNYPTLSFKDRVVSVALTCAREFGFEVVGCASTGNLANAVAAQGAASGFRTCILVPADLEKSKVLGTLVYGATLIGVRGNYDEVNRLCTQIAEKYSWGFVNVNLRPYYAEGSKTVGFEIQEQLGWKAPSHIVVPMAGGSLLTKIGKAVDEFTTLGWIEPSVCRLHGAQAAGCSPIVTAVHSQQDRPRPVKPHTIAKSLAIGNPADGAYAVRAIRESGGGAADATDAEIVAGISLLASTEGIFTETAGGVVVAATEKLIRSGAISPDESVVLCITGNGLKTLDVLSGLDFTATIAPSIREFETVYFESSLIQKV